MFVIETSVVLCNSGLLLLTITLSVFYCFVPAIVLLTGAAKSSAMFYHVFVIMHVKGHQAFLVKVRLCAGVLLLHRALL